MMTRFRSTPLVLLLVFLVLGTCRLFAAPTAATSPRERANFDEGWRFALGHPYDTTKDFEHGTSYFSYLAKAGYGDGPASPKFDDRAWRSLDLPHDWAVEAPFAADGSHSHGYKAVGPRHPERSVGWYRKRFQVSAADQGRRITVEFDGVYRDSVVWINGFYLGRQPSGHIGFVYDLSDYLNYGGENTLVVRADATMEEGWYYEGAGIYRHVWLNKTAPLHVAQWGIFVHSTVEGNNAAVTVETTLRNDGAEPQTLVVEQQLIDATGVVVARTQGEFASPAVGEESRVTQQLSLAKPKLWSLEEPTLYRVLTTLSSGGKILDDYSTVHGIRTLRFDPDHGFFLNGKHVVIKGTNNHQDHAGLGVALPDAVVEYRIRRLKEMGSNAYRVSHHPASPELLEICDRLGMLVMPENRLMGPSPEQLFQLESMIRRDRNHPSVFIWSVGNEEWAIEGNELGARLTSSMQAAAKRLDPTRRTTVAISGGWGAGSSTTADVMGFNYYTHGSTDEQHAKFPQQPGIGTEETTTQCTRGVYFDDRARGHLAHDPESTGDSGANCIRGWKHYAARPYLAGLFFWTGFDYRGEPTPFAYPTHSTQFGLMDSCGFAKDSYHYLRAWWTQEPVLHLYPHWNWAGREGQPITVGAYSNHEEVELLLNGQSLGRKPVPLNDRVEWKVPYAPGVLEARGFRKGAQVEVTRVETTGPVTRLALLNEGKAPLRADGRDVAVLSVQALDAKGRVVPTASNQLRFTVEGGKLLGVGNGDPSSPEADQFHATYAQQPLLNWIGRIAPADTKVPSAGTDGFRTMYQLGDWKAPLPKAGEVYELSADFSLAELNPELEYSLFIPTLGVETSLWLNGRELLRSADTKAAGPALRLEPALLVKGLNQLKFIIRPFEDGQRRRLPQLASFGTLRLVTPAPAATRSLFNGLAQVLVQAPKEAGTLKVRVQAKGLEPVELSLQAMKP